MLTFLIVLQQEFILAFRCLARLLASFLFFAISLTVFSLLRQENQDTNNLQAVFMSLIFCLIFANSDFLKKDFEDGSIEQMLASQHNFEIFVMAKLFANWLLFAIPALICSSLLGFDKINKFDFLIILALSSLAINCLCAFCGSLSCLENSASTISLIALPLIIPILLISLTSLETQDISAIGKILFGLAIFLFFTSSFAIGKIIKIAAE